MSSPLRRRLHFDQLRLGPGKAELLERIRETGSIAAAGRGMGMSYKRAWSLIEELNAAFPEPVVTSTRGGPGGGGAGLTPTGETVLNHFRALEAAARAAAAPHVAALERMLAPPRPSDMSERK